MRIAGLQKLTLLDFPGKTAATVFTPGCNFRCPFCHNADLVTGPATRAGSHEGDLSAADVLAFLEKRRGLLDGVCLTGGEPLIQPDLADFCARVRDLGFAVKLDTNGGFPDRLRALAEANLVDYVAMDVKNAPERYAKTVGASMLDLAPIEESMEVLRAGSVPFEFRTTVTRELHASDDLRALARWIGDASAWFLQNYRDAESVLGGAGRLHPWNVVELRALAAWTDGDAPSSRHRTATTERGARTQASLGAERGRDPNVERESASGRPDERDGAPDQASPPSEAATLARVQQSIDEAPSPAPASSIDDRTAMPP